LAEGGCWQEGRKALVGGHWQEGIGRRKTEGGALGGQSSK